MAVTVDLAETSRRSARSQHRLQERQLSHGSIMTGPARESGVWYLPIMIVVGASVVARTRREVLQKWPSSFASFSSRTRRMVYVFANPESIDSSPIPESLDWAQVGPGAAERPFRVSSASRSLSET